jgi:hypothetical protein
MSKRIRASEQMPPHDGPWFVYVNGVKDCLLLFEGQFESKYDLKTIEWVDERPEHKNAVVFPDQKRAWYDVMKALYTYSGSNENALIETLEKRFVVIEKAQ